MQRIHPQPPMRYRFTQVARPLMSWVPDLPLTTHQVATVRLLQDVCCSVDRRQRPPAPGDLDAERELAEALSEAGNSEGMDNSLKEACLAAAETCRGLGLDTGGTELHITE